MTLRVCTDPEPNLPQTVVRRPFSGKTRNRRAVRAFVRSSIFCFWNKAHRLQNLISWRGGIPATIGPPQEAQVCTRYRGSTPSDTRPDKPPEAPAPAGPPRRDEPPVGSTPPTEPTEPTEPTGPPGPSEPVESQLDIDDKTHKLNRLYWMRAALAVIAGISATFLFAPLEGRRAAGHP